MNACKYGDSLCPCQDGFMCHYEGRDAFMLAPPSPEQEGRDAALKGHSFKMCQYTYENSGARNMDEYANSGNAARRDQWFKGWTEGCAGCHTGDKG